MCNSDKRRRSRDRMLAPNLDQKAVLDGSRLLPGLIVRPGGRLVEGQSLLRTSRGRATGLALRERGPYTGDPRPVASLQKRARLLALCLLAPAWILPEPREPEPAQPQGARPGARDESAAAISGTDTPPTLGGLPHRGHYPYPGDGAGEGLQRRAVCRAGHLREMPLENRVGLRLQGGPLCEPGGRDLCLWLGRGRRRRAADRGL